MGQRRVIAFKWADAPNFLLKLSVMLLRKTNKKKIFSVAFLGQMLSDSNGVVKDGNANFSLCISR